MPRKSAKLKKDLDAWTIEDYVYEFDVPRTTARYRLEKLLKTGNWIKRKEYRWIDWENAYFSYAGGCFKEVNVYEQIA